MAKPLKGLFVKDPFKHAGGHLLEIGVKIIGAFFGFYLSNTLIPNLIKKPTNPDEVSPQSVIAPVLTLAVGVLGTIVFVPGMARSFFGGVAVGGGVDLLSDLFVKDKQFKFGLQTKVSGVEGVAGGSFNGLAGYLAGDGDYMGAADEMFGDDDMGAGEEMFGDDDMGAGEEMFGDGMGAGDNLFGESDIMSALGMGAGEEMFGDDMGAGDEMYGDDDMGAGDNLFGETTLEKVMFV